jgi:CRP/FNR family transcriptional regulator, cyclic AMP receptor protein
MRIPDSRENLAARSWEWDRDEFSGLGRPRRFRPGDVLLSPAHAATHAARITNGLVKVTAAADAGHETLLSIRGLGDLLNEEAAFRQVQRPGQPGRDLRITATALTDGSAHMFLADRLRRLLAEHPAHLSVVIQKLCERLEEAESRIASMGYESADRRLARLLCDLERHGRPARRGNDVLGTRIPLNLTHAELAAWIGACRETVDRALGRWRHRGIISTRYRTIIILDLEKLARIANVQVHRQAFNWPATGGDSARGQARRPVIPAPGSNPARRGAA